MEPDPNWPEVKEDFIPDGSLRDICVFETTSEEWVKALQFLYREADFVVIVCDGELLIDQLPTSFEEASSIRNGRSLVGKFFFRHIQMNCHFFSLDEIELDIDPAQIQRSAEFDVLLSACRGLAHAVSAPVHICLESFRSDPIATIRP